MVGCHVSADLLGAAGRYRVPRVPLPLHCAGSGRLPRSGARLWGMNCKARSRTTQLTSSQSQGSASGKRHARYRHGERRQSRAALLASAPRGTQGPLPLRGLLVTFPAAEKSLRPQAETPAHRVPRAAALGGALVTLPPWAKSLAPGARNSPTKARRHAGARKLPKTARSGTSRLKKKRRRGRLFLLHQ